MVKIGKFLSPLVALAALFVAACTSTSTYHGDPEKQFLSSYDAVTDGEFDLPEVPLGKLNSKYYRQIVEYETKIRPGTIVVNTKDRFLYLVMRGNKAMRYGISVGRRGFSWSGVASVGWKREWPVWTPPKEMIRRKPSLRKYADGMDPGLKNPLGSRALYLIQGGEDTMYRLHGTPQWWTIGKAASSGCIRLINQDIIDLYERVKPGAKVIVEQT